MTAGYYNILYLSNRNTTRIEWLPTLIEMTSLGEGGCDLA